MIDIDFKLNFCFGDPLYESNILKHDEKATDHQSINQSLMSGFEYFITLIQQVSSNLRHGMQYIAATIAYYFHTLKITLFYVFTL